MTTKRNKQIVRVSRSDKVFESRFNELKQFKERFNHCNVPQKYKENHLLGIWVNRLRWYYKNKDYRKLPQKEIDRLNSIGFIWVIKKRTAWEERFIELKEFKEKYGRLNDFTNKGLDFRSWVTKQRKKYKSGKLSKEHYQLLNSIGFFDGQNLALKQVLRKYKTILSFDELQKLLEVKTSNTLWGFVMKKTSSTNKNSWEPRLEKFLLKLSNDLSRFNNINCMVKYENIFKIREIERQINCPINTIQKTLRGTRPFPVKWEEPLKTFLGIMARDLKLTKRKNVSG